MAEKQLTIKEPVSFSGVGLHTGLASTITFNPAPEDYGFRFIRTDIPNNIEVPALVENVVDLSRGTTIGVGDVNIQTVEHVLAALVGLKVDNCKIEISGPELPVGDGSSLPYVETLLESGFQEQKKERYYFVVDETISYTNEAKGVDMIALPTDDYRVTVMIDYYNPALGSQHTGLFNLDKEFASEFAPARTFCFFTELQSLLEQGLIKGGQLDNSMVILDKDVTQKDLEFVKTKFNLKHTPKLGTTGFLNDTVLRFKNEPARHKLLDMIGDLALVGAPIKAQIMAARPGHASNIEFARKLKQNLDKKKKAFKFKLSTDANNIYDINELMKIIPHRYPFLLIDRIVEYDPANNSVVGIKNVTINEPFFNGHFPGNPIMPGVLICEAMAQTGCLMLLQSLDDITDKLALFMGIREAKFRKPVIPGDQLVMSLKLIGRKLNTYVLKGTAFVDGQIVAEAELSTAVITKKK